MALSFDSGTTVGTAGTAAITIAGGNEILVGFATQYNNVTKPTLTFAGTAMTYIGSALQTNALTIFSYYLLNPPTGLGTLSTTFGGGANSVSIGAYVQAAQSGQPDASNSLFAATTQNPTGTITTVTNNDWIVLGWYTDNTESSLTNAILRSIIVNGAGFGDSNSNVAIGANTQTINLSTAGNTVLAQVAIAPLSLGSGNLLLSDI